MHNIGKHQTHCTPCHVLSQMSPVIFFCAISTSIILEAKEIPLTTKKVSTIRGATSAYAYRHTNKHTE